jgi:hypothetical protein
MASAGVFPKTASSDVIYQADYNAIQSVIAGVVSTYYGNAVSSSQLSGNPTITALAVQQLIADIAKAYRHIAGDLFSPGFTPTVGQTITAAQFNLLKETADFCETNKNSVAAGFGQLATAVNNTSITTAWNGLHTWTYTYLWPSADAANYWFNAGGFFLVDVSGDGSTGTSKDNDWQNDILNAIATQSYGNTQWDAGSTIDVYEYGNVSQYAENYCRILIQKASNTQLNITVQLNDADAGDQQNASPTPGLPVDENVETNAYASITRYYSVDAITVTDPTPGNPSNW